MVEAAVIAPAMAELVTAAVDIDASTQLERGMLTVTEWPADRLPPGAVTSLSQIAFGSDLTPFTNGVIVQGEPVLQSKLVVHPPRKLLSQVVPDGMRAISIPVSDDTAVSGLVLPGDHVDVTAFIRTPREGDDIYNGRVIVRNVLVLAADQTFSQVVEGALPSNTVTLALTPQNATRVMAASRSHELGLALIGREELDRRAEEPAIERPKLRRSVRQVAAPRRAKPKTKEITVILGDRETIETAPVAGEGALK